MKNKTLLAALGLAGLFITANANAAAVIYNTGNAATATVALGVNDEGHLNTDVGNIVVNSSRTGVAYKFPDGAWRDATSPGCFCEGWGAAANGTGGSADVSVGGVSNITSDSFASTASTATSVTHLTSLPDLQITHHYQPAAANSNLFEAVVTLTNVGAGLLNDVRYTRAMDWDIPLTEFAEYVTIQGTATTTNLLYSSDDGFDNPNPFAGRGGLVCPDNSDYVDCGPSDHGALFDFGFGDLAAGDSISFSIFYGATATEAAALAAMGDIGAELFSFGQPSDGGAQTFIFAFKGVGGEVIIPPRDVPEPATVLLLGSGMIGAVAAARRRRKAA